MAVNPPIHSVTIFAVDPDGNPVGLAADADGQLLLAATIDTTGLALHTDVDGLEALVAATNAALATIDGHVDGLETLITSSNTKLDTLHTDLGALTDGTQKVKTSLPTGTHVGTEVNPNNSIATFGTQATTIGEAIFCALAANTAICYIGRNSSGLTAATGLELQPGDCIRLPCANINEYSVFAASSQKVHALAL